METCPHHQILAWRSVYVGAKTMKWTPGSVFTCPNESSRSLTDFESQRSRSPNRLAGRKPFSAMMMKQTQNPAADEMMPICPQATEISLILTSLSENGFRGGRFMMSDSAPSQASAMAGTMSVPRSMNKTVIVPNGRGIPAYDRKGKTRLVQNSF